MFDNYLKLGNKYLPYVTFYVTSTLLYPDKIF